MGLSLSSSQPFPSNPALPDDEARKRQLMAQMLMNMRGGNGLQMAAQMIGSGLGSMVFGNSQRAASIDDISIPFDS